MKVLAEGIEEGLIPIATGDQDDAWDPDNIFRNLSCDEVPEVR